ncbi:MAG: hypothetical protein H0W83_01770 [Planctomycetes bacterium]|nr:hypothetical protein [Planctomycetota bacterium]
MRFRVLSPTLLAIVAGLTGSVRIDAATVAERDEHFQAVQSLIERDIKASGERQKDDFIAAKYPDAQWCEMALSWFYADRMRSAETDAAKQSQLNGQVDALGKQLQAQLEKSPEALPEVVRGLMKGSGNQMLRLVNDLARAINPNDPPPLVGKDLPKDEKERRNFLVRSICEQATKDFKAMAVKVKAFEEGPEKAIADLDEKDPKFQKVGQEAAQMRWEAAKILYQAHIVLREVITRGEEFSIDPGPANAFWQATLKEHLAWLSSWDYVWGDNFIPLKTYVNILLAEAVRQKLPNITADDIEGELYKVVDTDLKPYSQQIRDQLTDYQMTAWAAILRWHLELGTDKDLKRGREAWTQLKERLKSGLNLRLNAPEHRSAVLAECYILAARIYAAKKDTNNASALLAEVSSAKLSQLSGNAKNWIAALNKGGGGESKVEWGVAPVAQDPEQALGVGKAFIQQANNTPEIAQARAYYLRAAIMLRNGILGLTNSAYEDKFVKFGPEVYERYAYALYKLDMRFHCAIAAEEGLRSISSRIPDKPSSAAPNPWRGKDGKWNEDGKAVSTLVQNGLRYASMLYSRAQGTGVQRLYDDAIELVKKISPEDAGKGLEWNQIVFKLGENDFEGGIELARAYAKKYPEENYRAFGVITDARMRKFDAAEVRLKSDPSAKAEMDKVADDLIKASEAMITTLGAKKDKTEEELKALSSAESALVFMLIKRGQYADVIAKLGADYWKHPPPEDLSSRMLQSLATALAKAQDADQKWKKDAAALVAAFPAQKSAYEIFERQRPRFKDEDNIRTVRNAGKALARVFQNVANQSEIFKAAGGPESDKMPAVSEAAKRAMADLIEPDLGAESDPRTILFMANLLYDMDEKSRSGRLYELFMRSLENDADMKRFKLDPKSTLDQVEAVVGQRPEFKGDWANVRTLLEDSPGLKESRAKGLPKEQWGPDQTPVDYMRAAIALREFKGKLEKARTVIGAEGYKRITEVLAEFEKTVNTLAQDVRVKTRLAEFYRDSGKSEEARKIYIDLIAYDPDDPQFAAALVDQVIEDLKGGKVVPKEQLDKARGIAINLREGAGKELVQYWQAQTQIFELSFAMNDLKPINNTLRTMRVAKSDISQDLVAPAARPDGKIKGDDKRVRRAKNANAKSLAERFLAVFAYTGVQEKPTFRIEEVSDANGKPWVLFIDIEAPKMVGNVVENAEGTETVVFLPEGESTLAEAKPPGDAKPQEAKPDDATPAPEPAKPVQQGGAK